MEYQEYSMHVRSEVAYYAFVIAVIISMLCFSAVSVYAIFSAAFWVVNIFYDLSLWLLGV